VQSSSFQQALGPEEMHAAMLKVRLKDSMQMQLSGQQWNESCGSEVSILAQRLAHLQVLHDDEAEAVRERPNFIDLHSKPRMLKFNFNFKLRQFRGPVK
jgi:hypothetical protein